ncbi:MAG: DUF4244 domain-containing protein [Acidimicrobiales bacterium]
MIDPLLTFVRAVTSGTPARWRDDRGQTTAEYALVLLGAASVALVLIAWAARTGKIAALFDAVVDSIISKL